MKKKLELKLIAKAMLRPPGEGIAVVAKAGSGGARQLQEKHYSLIYDGIGDLEIQQLWSDSLDCICEAKILLLGVPLDTGAGIRRGAAYGPRGVRSVLLDDPRYCKLIRSGAVLDIGDIFVNPHILHDEMLNDKFIRTAQKAMYPGLDSKLQKQLPVSALSQTEFLLRAILKMNPKIKIFVIGGDHSIAWPVIKVLSEVYPKKLGIVQPDAHTDLLESRLGVKYCFGTWSFHAIKLLGNSGKLVQVGIRESGRDQMHWEKTTGVKQFWAKDILKKKPNIVIQEIVDQLKKSEVEYLYFSNDVDGTDASEISATGTPAKGGVSSTFIIELIKALSKNFKIVAADVMEVAPDLAPTPEDRSKTLRVSASYVVHCLEGMRSAK